MAPESGSVRKCGSGAFRPFWGGRVNYSNIPVKPESGFENDVIPGRKQFTIGMVFRLMQK